MKSLFTILLATTLITGAYTCYSKPLSALGMSMNDKQNRHISGFTGVEVIGSYDVFIKQGNTESVIVEANDDVIDRIITEVEGGTLKIYTKKSNFNFSWENKKTAIYVTAKDLNRISVIGSGNVSFAEGISTSKLRLKLTGSGDVSGKVNVKTLESELTGSGDMKLSGQAQTSSVTVTGSGDFSGRDLATTKSIVQVRGSGNVGVNVLQQLDASVAGSGDIRYTGTPKQISSSKSGSGDIGRF
ncbi:head GIN domain-containing protein [Arcticibacter eurypsychrophilus]|uniref:head GIN domain-containing protein n=1 Tax=Arcticibacter eurypsychrophilus TaxID=1434752 RepID=UPI00084D93E4|nr:head GIN domain-containing protein [Arcticibacter eurypsychrophilus]